MSAYRVKHKATGLYYMRSRLVRVKYIDQGGHQRDIQSKSNLSKKGRIYSSVPSSSWYAGGIYNHVELARQLTANPGKVGQYTRHGYATLSTPTTVGDWEVEEMVPAVKPVKKLPVVEIEYNSILDVAKELYLVARAFDPGSPTRVKLISLAEAAGRLSKIEEEVVEHKPIRVNALVKYLPPTYLDGFTPGPGDARNEKTLVYLGEIPNMSGHGIFAGGSGKIHIGYHINEFVELTEDEV